MAMHMTGEPRDVSPRSRVLYAAAWAAGRSVLRTVPLNERSIAAAQKLDSLAGLAPGPRYARSVPHSFGEFDAEWVRSGDTRDDGAVLYFHGGGFFFCGLNTHRRCAARLSQKTGLGVFSVDYRQYPATDLTGSVTDCLTAYRHLLDEGIDPDRIVFAGDSAGGYLAMATAMRARDTGMPLPAGVVTLSALFEVDSSARMRHANAHRDTYVPTKHLPALSDLWSGNGNGRRPISPVDEDPRGLPPALIIAAESEVLRLDSELMAQRLIDAGVPCTLQLWPGQVHAFPVLGHMLPESKAALTEVATFIRNTTGGGSRR
ncbi:Acetyl esterase/lipase [Haloechinothrix alba]|uniref:Acetyl esterase/lipase n=1 Tax=Haloechinothrix alba TaxID=664784 RepID=A0A238Z0I0_9PSEU|nr:alpha/beta hydrolase [Haloechinothrix alba]SNR76438.1 Acetyl esterase/lipase [Haloechinothrix alba]